MKPLFRFFASNHTFAILFSIMLILLGLKSITTTNKDMFPSVDFGQVFIYTIYPNASPEDVELNVTNKIEEEIEDISGIDEFTSSSLEGVSRVSVQIDPDHKDEDEVVQKIREAVNRISNFPPEVEDLPTIIRVDSSLFPFLEVGFSSKTLSYSELRKKAIIFEKKLLNQEGISKVQKYGFQDREIKIALNPSQLKQYQVPITAVSEAIRVRNVRKTLGAIKSPTHTKNIVSLAELKTLEEVENIILRSTYEGKLIQIKDLARVKHGFKEATQETRMNGVNSILMVLFKNENSDMIEVAKKTKEFIENEDDKETEISINYTRDMSSYLANRYSVVKNNGLLGLLFLLIVLGTFLNIRLAIWVGLSIPVIIYGVFALLPLFIPHIDIITLAGFIIVMGIIVDDGIIISENILRRREMGDSPLDSAVNGLAEVFKPVVTTILTTFVAFAPMFFMPGVVGKFIMVIPLVVSLSLFVSLFECVIALPAHLVPSIKKIQPNKKEKQHWFISYRDKFEVAMKKILKYRYLIVIFYIALFIGSVIFTIENKNFVLFPSNQAEQMFIELEMPVGTSLETTSKKARELESYLLELPEDEVDSFSTKIGFKGRDEDHLSESIRYSQIAIYLTPYRLRSRTAEDIANELRKKMKIIKEGKIAINVMGGGPPVGRPIEIRVSHFNNKKRAALTNKVIKDLEIKRGVFDIERDDILGKKRIELKMNEEKISRLGLNVKSIVDTVSLAFSGKVVTSVRIDDEDIDYRVIFEEKNRQDLSTLKAIEISNKKGRLIPLSNLVEFVERNGTPDFFHFNGERTTTIYANIDKTKTTSMKIYKKLVKKYETQSVLEGGKVRFGGESEETQKSFQDLFKTFIVALVGIYFLLVLLFNSLIQPLLVLFCIPLGLIGVIFAFTLHNQDLSFFAMLGSIGLIGVLVNDALVLVYRVNKLKETKGETKIRYIVAKGAADRLRPILLTSLTTIAGVLPLAYGLGGSDPFIAPMGLALGYGLLFSTPLILVFIPSIYLIYEDISKTLKKLVKK